MPVQSLQSQLILTMSHWSSGLPIGFPSQVQIPWEVLMWNWDSPVSVVTLHWWPQSDWSLWSRRRRASSRIFARPSCWQCDSPTWSHTAFLSQFHTRCRSPFRLHNRPSRLLLSKRRKNNLCKNSENERKPGTESMKETIGMNSLINGMAIMGTGSGFTVETNFHSWGRGGIRSKIFISKDRLNLKTWTVIYLVHGASSSSALLSINLGPPSLRLVLST